MIPYGRQEITDTDIDSVVGVLRSDYITQGITVPRFEESVAKYTNASNAVAVNSATSALHLACLALGLGRGDWLWTTPNTFVASANCALYCGANVDFVDIDRSTYNISVDELEYKLKNAEVAGRIPKVIVVVHFAGQPCNMLKIHSLSQKYGFKIIEDASHAIGSSYYLPNDEIFPGTERSESPLQAKKTIKVGSCVHSDITIFSFHPVKIITTGEGGMALTNSDIYANKMRCLRSHGIINNKERMESHPDDEIWNYEQIDLGYNYRMTDIQAALGLSQMQRLDDYIKIRQKIAAVYDNELKKLCLITPWQLPNTYSSYHLYPIRITKEFSIKTQKEVYHSLHKNGVAANLHYIPVHRQPYYQKLGFKSGDFPEAEKYHREAISLPMYPMLTSDEQQHVINVLRSVLS